MWVRSIVPSRALGAQRWASWWQATLLWTGMLSKSVSIIQHHLPDRKLALQSKLKGSNLLDPHAQSIICNDAMNSKVWNPEPVKFIPTNWTTIYEWSTKHPNANNLTSPVELVWTEYSTTTLRSPTWPTRKKGLQQTRIKNEIASASDRSISSEKKQKERAATGRATEPPVGLTTWIWRNWREQRSLKETWTDDSPNRLREWVERLPRADYPVGSKWIQRRRAWFPATWTGRWRRANRERIVTASPPCFLFPFPWTAGFRRGDDVTPIGFCAGPCSVGVYMSIRVGLAGRPETRREFGSA